jgi:hypothetical protein
MKTLRQTICRSAAACQNSPSDYFDRLLQVLESFEKAL